MKKNILIIFLTLFYFSNSAMKSQPFYVGVKSEPFYLTSKIDSEIENKLFVTSFYLLGGVNLTSNIQLETQYGLLLSEGYRYNGFEICLTGKYFLRENKEFITCGFILHKNGGENSASHISEGNYLSLLSIGIGTYLKEILFIQVLYQFPVSDNLYANNLYWDFQAGSYNKIPLRIIGILKLSIGLTLDL